MENENNKYHNSIIYKIFDKDTNECYIGSTIQTLEQRLYYHEHGYKNNRSYVSSFEILKNNNYNIEPIEEVKCENNEELRIREQYHIDLNDCVNKANAFGLNKENQEKRMTQYRIENKEKIKQYRIKNKEKYKENDRQYYIDNKEKLKNNVKQYVKNNKEKVKEKYKEYYVNNKEKIKEYKKKWNKEKILCECGIELLKSSKSNHEKTNKHKQLMETK